MSEALSIVRNDITPEQLDLIKRTIAAGATDDELRLYMHDCQRQGVHPLDRLLHFTKRGGKYVPITSIDLMRSRAADTGELAGIDDAVFLEEDGRPQIASVTVYRLTQGHRFSYTASARWSEYYPGEGAPGFMWRKMSFIMLAKCAEGLALRKAFPRQLAGLYEKAEMDQGEEKEPRTPRKGEMVRSEAEVLATLAEPVTVGTEVLTPAPYQGDAVADELKVLKHRFASVEKAGILHTNGSDAMRRGWMGQHLGRPIKSIKDVDAADLRRVNARLMEMLNESLGASAEPGKALRSGEPGAAPGSPAPGSVPAPEAETAGVATRGAATDEGAGISGAVRSGAPSPDLGADASAAPSNLEPLLQESVEREKWRKAWFALVEAGVRHKAPGLSEDLKGNDKAASAARASLLSRQCGEVVPKFAEASADQLERGVIVLREQLTEFITGVPAK